MLKVFPGAFPFCSSSGLSLPFLPFSPHLSFSTSSLLSPNSLHSSFCPCYLSPGPPPFSTFPSYFLFSYTNPPASPPLPSHIMMLLSASVYLVLWAIPRSIRELLPQELSLVEAKRHTEIACNEMESKRCIAIEREWLYVPWEQGSLCGGIAFFTGIRKGFLKGSCILTHRD